MPPLDPTGAPTRVGAAVMRTPGLSGEASELPPSTSGTRDRGIDTTNVLEEAIRRQGLRREQVIQLKQTREVAAPRARTRSTTSGEAAIELEVPDPGPEMGQLVLYTDEAGVSTWNLARDEGGDVSTTRGRGTRTYLIRRHVAQPSPTRGTRGLVSGVATKVLQVLVFPLLDPVLGRVADGFAKSWEEKKRPYRIRRFGPSDYTTEAVAPLETSEWTKLASGRALLFVHGTFGRAHLAFPTFPSTFLRKIEEAYGGRLFAFEHFTISEDPRLNAQRFVDALPAGIKLDIDIINHSRGGLVSRALAELLPRLDLGGRKLTVGTVVHIASPSAGCVLADADAMTHLVDRYTNWMQFLPANAAVDVLEAAITVLKMLAVGAFKGLGGLACMAPGSAFFKEINAPDVSTASSYRALTANYEPIDGELKSFAHNAAMDLIFKQDNDLVVPTGGVWEANGSPMFPIAERLVFGKTDGVDHGGFFTDPRAQKKILEWLPGS